MFRVTRGCIAAGLVLVIAAACSGGEATTPDDSTRAEASKDGLEWPVESAGGSRTPLLADEDAAALRAAAHARGLDHLMLPRANPWLATNPDDVTVLGTARLTDLGIEVHWARPFEDPLLQWRSETLLPDNRSTVTSCGQAFDVPVARAQPVEVNGHPGCFVAGVGARGEEDATQLSWHDDTSFYFIASESRDGAAVDQEALLSLAEIETCDLLAEHCD